MVQSKSWTVYREVEKLANAHSAYAMLRGVRRALINALNAVPELNDRPRTALDVTERWLDGAATDHELRAVWRAVPLIDRNRGEASWHEAALATFFYGNAATRQSERQTPNWYEWTAVAMRLINVWELLGEPTEAAGHRVLEELKAGLVAPSPPPPAGWWSGRN